MHAPGMNPWYCAGLVVFAALNLVSGAEAEKFTYYVQLVRGNNDEKPPMAGARQIGPTLSKKLRPVFKWESYWEISRQQTNLSSGQKSIIKLGQERAVQIDLTEPSKRKVTAYQSGKPVARTTSPVGASMSLIGGDRDTNSAWFIVVRRDKPKD